MRIRAAVLEQFAKPLVVREVDLDEPGPVRSSSVSSPAASATPTCTPRPASTRPATRRPCSGHEGAGVVEAVGAERELVKPGDHVVTLFSPQCGECVHCRSPLTNLCLAIREQQNLGYLPDGTTRLSRDGEPLRHFMGTSTFAEYTVMPEIALARIDPEAPLDRPPACSPAASRPGSARRSGPRPCAPARPASCSAPGMVGLGAVAGCRLQGAERIICVDLSPDRLELARGQGATDT
jgi:S-(hydroxymethyl)glutathione dehydrogenase/alcohol dehydrogenase